VKLTSKIVLMILSGLLFVIAGLEWFTYMAQGIAHGDLYGVPGREQDLAQMGARGIRALDIAVCCEILAVVIVSWTFIATSAPRWLRLSIGLVLALVATFLSYGLVRGL
jgi:hypothetical protein